MNVIETMESRVLLSAGELDVLFGDNGVTAIAMPGGAAAELHELVAWPDGRILGVGTSNSRLIFARFLHDGRPDPSFGGTSGAPRGVVDTGLPGGTGLIKWVGKGRFVFASGSRLIRFNSDGSVDPTFRQDEPSRYKFSFSTADVDVQPDGKILLAGRYKQTPAKPGHFAVARLNANGTRDRTFGIGGVADFFQHTNSPATAVRMYPTGWIFVAGGINHGYPSDLDEYTRQDLLCMLLRPDGAPEMNYGINGVAKMTGRFFAGATMRATLSGGTATIIAAGDDLRVYRIGPDGMPDSTYGMNGVASALSFNGSVFRPTIQDDGALLLTFRDFTTPQEPQRQDRLLRFTPAGEIDNSFGDNGVANLPAAYQPVVLNSATIANDDSILVAGRASDGRMLVARFWGSEAPAVQVHTKNRRLGGTDSHRLTISVRDDKRIDPNSLQPPPIHIESPQGVSMRVRLISIDTRDRSGSVVGLNVKLAPPGGTWGPEDNGAYEVQLHGDRISDNELNRANGRIIGTFWVHI